MNEEYFFQNAESFLQNTFVSLDCSFREYSSHTYCSSPHNKIGHKFNKCFRGEEQHVHNEWK